MSSPHGLVPAKLRVASIVAAVAAAGALAGGLSAAGALFVVALLQEGVGALSSWVPYAIAGVFGTVLGCVLAPILGFTLLRRVPLAKAFLGPMLGAVLGGVIGWLLPLGAPINLALLLAVLGTIAAAARLHVTHDGEISGDAE